MNDLNVYNLLEDIIKPSQIDTDIIKQKDSLNPKLWDKDFSLKNDIRKYLLKNALFFLNYLNIENLKISDITLTGSSANYNWNDYSDIDIHIIMDITQISNNLEIVKEFLKTKKDIWNNSHNIKIKGIDVELYVQDVNEEHTSTGVFSILNNKWISKPIKQMISIDVNNIKHKTLDIINIIDMILNIKDKDTAYIYVKKIKDKIKKYRQSGLNEFGEYSTENLVFKLLRNYGYLDKLEEFKNTLIDNKLTLENEKI